MDMQAKIAARRAEIETQTRESHRLATEATKAEQAAAEAQRVQALDEIAAEVSRDGLDVQRQGGELKATAKVPIPLDVDGLKRSAVDKLLGREARKMWTPAENWQVITLIVAGVFLITAYGLGLGLILVGLINRNALNKRYKAELRQRYPAVFLEPQTPPSATKTG